MVFQDLGQVVQAYKIKVDFCISVLKPLHASWLAEFYCKTENETDRISN